MPYPLDYEEHEADRSRSNMTENSIKLDYLDASIDTECNGIERMLGREEFLRIQGYLNRAIAQAIEFGKLYYQEYGDE